MNRGAMLVVRADANAQMGSGHIDALPCSGPSLGGIWRQGDVPNGPRSAGT